MNSSQQRWVLAVFFALAAIGFLLPLWPLSALAVVLMSAWGRWLFAISVGLLLDLAWGAPVGLVHYVYFPFTLLAVVTALVRAWSAKYFIDRGLQERL
jgi:hypothetical protein